MRDEVNRGDGEFIEHRLQFSNPPDVFDRRAAAVQMPPVVFFGVNRDDEMHG